MDGCNCFQSKWNSLVIIKIEYDHIDFLIVLKHFTSGWLMCPQEYRWYKRRPSTPPRSGRHQSQWYSYTFRAPDLFETLNNLFVLFLKIAFNQGFVRDTGCILIFSLILTWLEFHHLADIAIVINGHLISICDPGRNVQSIAIDNKSAFGLWNDILIMVPFLYESTRFSHALRSLAFCGKVPGALIPCTLDIDFDLDRLPWGPDPELWGGTVRPIYTWCRKWRHRRKTPATVPWMIDLLRLKKKVASWKVLDFSTWSGG